MKKIQRFTLSLAALLMVSGLALSAPVSARADNRDSTTTNTTASTDSQIADETTTSSETETQASNTLAEQFREQAKTRVESERQNVKERTEAEREKSCTVRKTNLTKRMADAVAAAKRHQAVIDTAYARVKAFHDSKNLNVPDYVALTTAVDTAQANAKTSIAALSALDVSVDCTSQTVASSVGAFQSAVKNTRDSLKDYRTALVKLIEALKGASTGTETKTSQNSTTNTSNQ